MPHGLGLRSGSSISLPSVLNPPQLTRCRCTHPQRGEDLVPPGDAAARLASGDTHDVTTAFTSDDTAPVAYAETFDVFVASLERGYFAARTECQTLVPWFTWRSGAG